MVYMGEHQVRGVAEPGERSPTILKRQLRKDHERRWWADARSRLMKPYDLRSVMASPGEDTQHCDLEREERENLTNVHLTCRYPRRRRRHAIAPHVAKPEATIRRVEGSGTGTSPPPPEITAAKLTVRTALMACVPPYPYSLR